MALTPEDVQAIGQLLDSRMAQHSEAIAKQLREQDRRRRRFWSWVIWITVVLTVASSVWSYYWLKGRIGALVGSASMLERELQQANTDLVETRGEYARQLAHDKQMQKERAEAVSASGYKSDQNQAQFDAGMLAKTFALFNRTNEARTRAESKAKSGDTEPDDQSVNDLDQTISQASGLLMQLMLHETDNEHLGSAEKMAQGEHPDATPIQQPPAAGQAKPLAAPTPQPPRAASPAPPAAPSGAPATASK